MADRHIETEVDFIFKDHRFDPQTPDHRPQ
jgi:hypothetical protein